MTTKPTLQTVQVVPQPYQPSKAELSADLRIKGTFKQGVQALSRPVRLQRALPKRAR